VDFLRAEASRLARDYSWEPRRCDPVAGEVKIAGEESRTEKVRVARAPSSRDFDTVRLVAAVIAEWPLAGPLEWPSAAQE
jgi:hypothetical protein